MIGLYCINTIYLHCYYLNNGIILDLNVSGVYNTIFPTAKSDTNCLNSPSSTNRRVSHVIGSVFPQQDPFEEIRYDTLVETLSAPFSQESKQVDGKSRGNHVKRMYKPRDKERQRMASQRYRNRKAEKIETLENRVAELQVLIAFQKRNMEIDIANLRSECDQLRQENKEMREKVNSFGADAQELEQLRRENSVLKGQSEARELFDELFQI